MRESCFRKLSVSRWALPAAVIFAFCYSFKNLFFGLNLIVRPPLYKKLLFSIKFETGSSFLNSI